MLFPSPSPIDSQTLTTTLSAYLFYDIQCGGLIRHRHYLSTIQLEGRHNDVRQFLQDEERKSQGEKSEVLMFCYYYQPPNHVCS
jgi:hypothetical protein